MVVCKFYLQGYCKFGNSCRYEHTSSNAYGRYESEYFQNRNAPSYQSGKISQELQDLVRSVQDDVLRSEKGGQWPLSCYSPFRQKACLPDWQELSPEEMRWMMYQAAQTGSVEACKQQVKEMLHTAELQKAQLLSPNAEVCSMLEKVYKGEIKDPITFSFAQSTNSPDGSVFAGSSVFGGGQSTGPPSSINTFSFALPQLEQSQANAVFGNPPSVPQNVSPNYPQQSIFGNAAVKRDTIFGGGDASSVFVGSPQQNQVFGQQGSAPENYYFEAPPVAASSDVFSAQSKSVFGSSSVNIPSSAQPNPVPSSPGDTLVYSARSELTEEEITQFMNPTFSLAAGKIPTKPPPRELCL